MKTALTTIQYLIRGFWTVILILGLLYWAGMDSTNTLIKIHILAGVILVLSMLGLAYLAVRARVSAGLVVLDIGWGLVLPALGLTQAQIFPGPAHWAIHVVHLLVGIGALWQAETLGSRTQTGLEAIRSARHPVLKVKPRG